MSALFKGGEGRGLTSNISYRRRQHSNIAPLKPSRAFLSKNKVRHPDDLAAGIVLLPPVGEDGVLIPLEGAAVVAAVGVRGQGYGLRPLAVGVYDVEVVDLDVVGFYTDGARLVVGGAGVGLGFGLGYCYGV